MMLHYLKLYIITLIVFTGVDAVWLIKMAPAFYNKHIGHLLAENPNIFAAAIFYLINIAGIIFFAINPAINKNSWQTALFFGAFYGLVTYATYDLTNQATMKNWPVVVTLVDIAWGTLLSAAVATISYLIYSRISG